MYVTVAVTESNSTGGTTGDRQPSRPGSSTAIHDQAEYQHQDRPLLPLRPHLHAPETHGATTYKPKRADDGRYINGRHHAHPRQGQGADRDHSLDRPDHRRHRG